METFFHDFKIFQIICKSWSFLCFRNHLHQLRTIRCKGNTFHCPISPLNPSKVLNQPCSENISFSFQETSVKHHLPKIDGKFVISTCGTLLCSFNTCASAQSIDYVSAKLSVSLGSISRLLKTLLFVPFQMYHNIHANWWSSICGKTFQIDDPYLWRESLFGK